MKARIRNTNIEVDVQPFYDETGYFAGFKDGYEYYRSADLIFPDTPDWDKTDWSSFRREAAKDILCAILGRVERFYTGVSIDGKNKISNHKDFIELAIKDADELIRQLKQE